jgi:hypothetical protein
MVFEGDSNELRNLLMNWMLEKAREREKKACH